MMWLAKFVLTLAVAVWLGETVFLSLVAAPVLFSSMGSPQEAGSVMTLLFPPYYGVAALCALLVAGLSWWLWRRTPEQNRTWLLSGGLAVAGLVCVLWAWLVVLPRAHELRDATRLEPPPVGAKAEFDRLHRLSVQLNGAVLVLTLATAGVLAVRIR